MSRNAPLNVKKREIACAGERAPLKSDVFLYFCFAVPVSTVIFFIFTDIVGVISNPYLRSFEKFFILIGVYVFSDLISGYVSTYPTAYLISKSYSTCYFIRWYSFRTMNVIRNFINWILNSLIYVYAVIDNAALFASGYLTIEMRIVFFLLIKGIVAAFSYGISELMTKSKIFTQKEEK